MYLLTNSAFEEKILLLKKTLQLSGLWFIINW